MAIWYNIGTASVTNGSEVVDIAGAALTSNVVVGEAFMLRGYPGVEIAEVVSATRLRLAYSWTGPSLAGQAYSVMPTTAVAVAIATQAFQQLAAYQQVRDTVGQGMFPDGAGGTPGVRFAADQDTGLRRTGANSMAWVTGGVDRITVDATGRVGFSGVPVYPVTAYSQTGQVLALRPSAGGSTSIPAIDVFDGTVELVAGLNTADAAGFIGTFSAHPFGIVVGGVERARVDVAGNLLVGSPNGAAHRLRKAVSNNAGATILDVQGSGAFTASFFGVSGGQGSAANSAVKIATDAVTNRSINAGGTLNASGADYAEYMTKADGCGTIAAGEVCGVTAEGKLTRTWADAIGWVIKSTDPAYVGGDSWAAHLPARPDEPAPAPVAPVLPVRGEDEEAESFAERLDAYVAAAAIFPAAKAAHDAEVAAHAEALAAWEEQLEAARQKVDRIAFSGQVPVAVSGSFMPGDYLIAAANGGGIKAVAVPEAEIALDQYRRRLGRVWRVLDDGRAWVDVQHG